jgi:hypothetical protein
MIHSADTSSGQSDKRSANLERIIRHFLGDVPMDDDNVQHIAEKVEKASKESQSRSKLNNLDMVTGGLNVNESFDVRFVSQNTARTSTLLLAKNTLLIIVRLFGRILALEFFAEGPPQDEPSPGEI